MKRVYQTIQSQSGTIGDCFRCAIASLLERPADDVPHFFASVEPGRLEVSAEEIEAIDSWFMANGLRYVEISLPFMGQCLEFGRAYPGLHYLITGMNGRSVHTVVARDGDIVHNPGGDDRTTGCLPEPTPDGRYRIGIIAKNL